MPIPRRVLVRLLASAMSAAIVVTLTGCEQTSESSRVDTSEPAGQVPGTVDSLVGMIASGWDARAGPVLLVAAERSDAAIVVLPDLQGEHAAVDLEFDTATVRGATVTLVGRAGLIGSAILGAGTTPGEEEECVGWPMFRVIDPYGAAVPRWTVGLTRSQLVPVPLDSVESLAPRDSAALVAEVARLASTIPMHGGAARLRGLPFSVEDLRRFRVRLNVDILVAYVVRRIHQEANPVEERTLLVAERDNSTEGQAQYSERYTLAFELRAVGREETLEGSEVLAVLAARNLDRPMLVIARESESGVRYVLLERVGNRDWRVRWTSALVRC